MTSAVTNGRSSATTFQPSLPDSSKEIPQEGTKSESMAPPQQNLAALLTVLHGDNNRDAKDGIKHTQNLMGHLFEDAKQMREEITQMDIELSQLQVELNKVQEDLDGYKPSVGDKIVGFLSGGKGGDKGKKRSLQENIHKKTAELQDKQAEILGKQAGLEKKKKALENRLSEIETQIKTRGGLSKDHNGNNERLSEINNQSWNVRG